MPMVLSITHRRIKAVGTSILLILLSPEPGCYRANRLPFGLIIVPPCPTTAALVQCVAGNPLGPNNLPASRSKGTLFNQLNVRHAFNMTRGPTMVGP